MLAARADAATCASYETTRSGTTVTYRTRGVSGPDTATVTEPATVAASRATWNSYPPAYTTDRIAAASQNDSSATGTRSRMCCLSPGRSTAVFAKPTSRRIGSSRPGTGNGVAT